jgi:hypothetical protein
MRQRLIVLIAVCTCALLASCSGDCEWGATAIAWDDRNGNQAWDYTEEPLRNVRFVVDDIGNDLKDVCRPAASDVKGRAKLYVFLAGCPEIEFEVRAEPPAGYLPTTPERVRADHGETDEAFSFGFTHVAGGPEPTALPPASLTCWDYDVRQSIYSLAGDVTGLAIAPDGALWVTTNDELRVAQFAPESMTRTTYSEEDGIPGWFGRTLDIGMDGTVWLASNRGVARFDGAQWHGMFPPGQETDNDFVWDIAVAPNGDVWLVSERGKVSRYGPASDTWEVDMVNPNQLASDHPIDSVLPAEDGAVWLFSMDSVYQMIPTQEKRFDWIVHKRGQNHRPGSLISVDGDTAILTQADALWLAGGTAAGSSVVRWNVEQKQWTTYNHRTTGGAMYAGTVASLAAGINDSLWIGLEGAGALHFIPGRSTKPDIWLHYTPDNGLPIDRVLAIAVAPNGVVWFGGDTGYVQRCMEQR